jgi:hypothetical protein
MKISFVGAFALALLSVSAMALEIPESLVGKYVEAKLPKSVAGVQLLAPTIKLNDGDANFCATARPKLFPKSVEFCANLTPKWSQETSSMLGTKMTLTSVKSDGLSEKYLEMATKVVNKSVLPALEGMEIYKNDSFIGKRVSVIIVKPGKLNVAF